MAFKSGLKVPLLTLGPSCPLQTILLSDLLGCGSPLQILMAVWRTFFKFEARQMATTICRGLSRPTQQVQILKKEVRQTSITVCRGLSHLTGWTSLASENISRRFFQGQRMNMKGLAVHGMVS